MARETFSLRILQTDANFILLGSPRSNPWSNLIMTVWILDSNTIPVPEKRSSAMFHPRAGETFRRMQGPLRGGPRGSRMRSWRFLRIWIRADRYLFLAGQTAEEQKQLESSLPIFPDWEHIKEKCGIQQSGSEHFEILLRLNTPGWLSQRYRCGNCRVF